MEQSVRRSGLLGCCGLAVAWLLVAGCDDECKRGTSECVSDALLRVCVPGVDGNEWLVTQCGANETCATPPAARSGGSRDAGGQDSGTISAQDSGTIPVRDAGTSPAPIQPACVGVCSVGAHECVNDAVARYCANAGVWELQACDVGKKCLDGRCVLSSDGAVQACMPKQKLCASDKVAKLCPSDGSGWLEVDCAANEICRDGSCAPDPKSSCDDANSCLDNKSAVRCLGKDAGFQLVKCDGDTYCEAGRCRGPVCAIGSICSGSNQLRECVDGTSYKDRQCGVNEICQQSKDTASCVPLQCQPGNSLCGDPRDVTVDPKKFFSSCVNGVGSGIPEWVKGECTGNTTCNPTLTNTGNPCSQTCTKGAQRCANDPLSGINDGYEECDDKGEWGPIQTCNPGNESRLQCVVPPRADLSTLPKALCAEPICFWIFTNTTAGATGTCSGTQLRMCQPDGTLAAPSDCAQGICRSKRSNIEADGRMPGACDTSAECKDGEEICANVSGPVTPRYRSCEHGLFGAELKTCDNDAPCYNSQDADGLRKKLCGASCSPGTRRCSGNGLIDQCNAVGQWRGAQRCDAGSCKTVGNNDAACVLECMPGSKLCTGASLVAPDNYHLGTAQEVICSADGLRGTPRACATGTVCRVSDASVALGCVACIGPNVPGGNDEGTADSRCDPADITKVQDCSSGNSWSAGRSCSGNRNCVSPTTGTCGNCVGAHNGSFECTESNLAAEPICDSCNVMLTGGGSTLLSVCSEANVAATSNASSTTCTGQGLGAPSNWAGVDNCCASAQTTAGEKLGANCASLGYGAASAWGNTPDCCGNYQIGTGGAASFAYCE